MSGVDAAGVVGLHEAPVGSSRVTPTGNGDGLDGRSGPVQADGAAQSQEREEKKVELKSEMGDALRQSEGASEDIPAITTDPMLGPTGGGRHLDVEDKNPETGFQSSTEPPNPGATIQKVFSHTPVFVSPQTSTSLSVWSQDGATASSLPDPLLPEIGPNFMPKEDGPESLWTEAARPGGGE